VYLIVRDLAAFLTATPHPQSLAMRLLRPCFFLGHAEAVAGFLPQLANAERPPWLVAAAVTTAALACPVRARGVTLCDFFNFFFLLY
jgi:hypothetical protein